MKKILISMLAVAALVSCSKEESILVDQGEAIAFGNAFVENSTRAAVDPSYKASTLTYFDVYGAVNGVNIFDGDRVARNDKAYGVAWDMDPTAPTQYWIAGASYIFDAVVDATAVATDNNTGLPTALTYNMAGQKDMLHSRVVPTTNSGLVTFNFTHLLSKVKFTVENDSEVDTKYRYTVTDITLTNVYTKGDYAIPACTWGNTTLGTYNIADMTIAGGATEECASEVLLIPGVNIGISFNVNAQIFDGEEWVTLTTTPVVKTGVKTLVANNAYNFIATVKMGGKIEFTATQLPEWNYDLNGDGQDNDDITLQ